MRTVKAISCVVLAAAFSLAIAARPRRLIFCFHGRAINPYDTADQFASQMGEDRFVLTYLRTVYGYDHVDYLRGEYSNPDGSLATTGNDEAAHLRDSCLL